MNPVASFSCLLHTAGLAAGSFGLMELLLEDPWSLVLIKEQRENLEHPASLSPLGSANRIPGQTETCEASMFSSDRGEDSRRFGSTFMDMLHP